MKAKNLYRDEMLKYVSGCESGVCTVVELVSVYNEVGRSKKIDRRFVKKRVERFCRSYGTELTQLEIHGYVGNVKGFYQFTH